MLPNFLKSRKTYLLVSLIFTIICIIGLSFAFFRFSSNTDNTTQNVVILETINESDVTKSFTIVYDDNDGTVTTGILNTAFQKLFKFRVISTYSATQTISINWGLVKSTIDNTNSSYILYNCTSQNYVGVTLSNVASRCSVVSPTSSNYLPNTNEQHKLTTASDISLAANETKNYVAVLNIESSESGKGFSGTISVKHRVLHTLSLNLNGGSITSPTSQDMKTGDTVEIPVPTKAGYFFEGWSIGNVDSVINQYTFTMGSADTTLTAAWTADIQNYAYTGGVQTFVAPVNATYKIEAWGAQGGSSQLAGGNGAYTKGEIYLEKETKLYVYVGQQSTSITGGYNGGGSGASTSGGKGGGGATDIRYFASTPTSDQLLWNNALGLNSRIMVAGGGGGSDSWSSGAYGGNAGGLIGGAATVTTDNTRQYTQGGTQSAGGSPYYSSYVSYSGGFGQGGNGNSTWGTGGGSGYYGGGGGGAASPWVAGGGGGSSYISGHAGCISINNLNESANPRTILSGCTSTSTNLDCSYHLSGKKFTNTIMIDGAGYQWTTAKGSLLQMPNWNGGSYASGNGNIGDGFAKITIIS